MLPRICLKTVQLLYIQSGLKVSQCQESLLNRIKNRQRGYISYQF